MKIGIDARMLGKGAGLARYVEQVLLQVVSRDSSNTYVLFVRDAETVKHVTHTIEHVPIEVVVVDIPWYTMKEQVLMRGVIKKAGVDMMHFPHWNVPYFCPVPYVVTIHDLTMFHFARREATTLGPVRYFLKDKAHRLLVKRVVKKAKHIITTSEFTKQDIHKMLGTPLTNMTTVYQATYNSLRLKNPGGQAESIVHGRESQEQHSWEDVLGRFGLDLPYALFVGQAYPHKNILGLLRAWKRFEDTFGTSDYKLVLVGKENIFWKRILSSSEMMACKNVVYTGFVDDEALSVLYEQASQFVFPSLYEGFGLPPLEAMAKGIPVVSSNRSCMPEILGEGALYVDPENDDQLAEAMYRVFSDEDVRADLVQRGKKEVKRYSWKKFGEETKRIYTLAG